MKSTHCPVCATPVHAPAKNDTFPFCGRRCRSADLGRWLDGEYRLSEEPRGLYEMTDSAVLDELRSKGLASVLALVVSVLGLSSVAVSSAGVSSAMAQTADEEPAAAAPVGAAPPSASTAPAEPAPDPRPASSAAGGSAPVRTSRPAPAPPALAPSAEQQNADAPPAEDEDDHGIVYLGADFGYSWINLVQFSANNFIPAAERLDGNGWTFGLNAGFRIFWFTLGGRGTLSSYPGFEIGTVGLDLGLHIPIPVIEPYLRGGLSYGWMGNANYSTPGLSDTSVTGLVADVGGGLNIYLNDHISIGAGVDAAFLNLTRQKLGTGAAGMVTDINVSESGDAVGLQLRFHGQLTIHI